MFTTKSRFSIYNTCIIYYSHVQQLLIFYTLWGVCYKISVFISVYACIIQTHACMYIALESGAMRCTAMAWNTSRTSDTRLGFSLPYAYPHDLPQRVV